MDLSNKSNGELADHLSDILIELRELKERSDTLKKDARAIQKELQSRQMLPESFNDMQDPKAASSIKNAKDFIVKKYAIQRMLNDPSLMDDPETANAVWKRWSDLIRQAYEQGITDHQGNILESIEERKLSKKEIKTRDKYADDLPDKEFKKRYGKDWESVKYATATKMAKKKNEDVNEGYILGLSKGAKVQLIGRVTKPDPSDPYGRKWTPRGYERETISANPNLEYTIVDWDGEHGVIVDPSGEKWRVTSDQIDPVDNPSDQRKSRYSSRRIGSGIDATIQDPAVDAVLDKRGPYDLDFDDEYYDAEKDSIKAAPPNSKRIEARKKIERHQRERAERERIKALKQKRRNEDVEQELMDQWLAEKADPCWKGYKQIGMKKKGNKDVPNCVPKKGKKKS